MTAIAIIAVSIATVAVAAMWLWTRPDVRAWLAGHWDRAWRTAEPHWVRVREALKPHQERLAVAGACLVTVVILFDGGLAAAVAFAIAAGMLWRLSRAEQAVKTREQALLDAGRGLAARLNKAEAAADAYGDALNDVLSSGDLDTAQARARTALESGPYMGVLAAAREGLEECELRLRDVRAELADKRPGKTTSTRFTSLRRLMARPKRSLGRAIREDFEDDTEVRFEPLKWILWTVAVVVVIGLIVWFAGWLTQPLRTAAGVREKVGDANNVLYQYEHFHDLCADVRAIDSKIKAKQDEINAYDKRHPDGDKSDEFQAAPKRDRLDTELAGLKQRRADQVETYNADSAKANRSLFKDGSLPERLDESTPVCN